MTRAPSPRQPVDEGDYIKSLAVIVKKINNFSNLEVSIHKRVIKEGKIDLDNLNSPEKEESKIDMKLSDEDEKNFYKLSLLSLICNEDPSKLDKFEQLDINLLYLRLKQKNIEF